MKLCSKCKTEKPLSDFGKHTPVKGMYSDGLRYQCKACEYADTKLRRSTPEAQAKRKAYRQQPEVQAKDREYMRRKLATPEGLALHRERSRSRVATTEGRLKHREATLCYAKTHVNGSYAKQKTDPVFKLALNFKRLLNTTLKAKAFPKLSRSTKVLGCDFEFFHLYLEMQFQPEMSWDNFGEWHIDHKVPIGSATTIEKFYALNHFSNLQPMWRKYNFIKNDMQPDQWIQYIKVNNINLGVRP